MSKFYKLTLLCMLCFIIIFNLAQAQTDSLKETNIDSIQPKSPYFKIGINFVNNNVFVGRTDTITTPSITPEIRYAFKSGVYFAGSIDYFTNRTKNKLDGGSLEAGYDYDITDDWDGGLSFTKMFYNANSTQVSSSISSELNTYMDYDIADIITPSISLNYSVAKSGDKNDILINPSLSHDFTIASVFGDHDVLLISPEIGMNAGTQNFYASYLVGRTIKFKRGAGLAQTEYNQNLKNYQEYLSDFKLLDYELTLPVVYKYGHIILSFTPTYAFPQNGLAAPENQYQKAIQKGVPQLNANEFYFETGISVKF